MSCPSRRFFIFLILTINYYNNNNVFILDAFLPVGLKLVGPYDVLTGRMNTLDSKYLEKGVLHWRYYYDPPEFQVSSVFL